MSEKPQFPCPFIETFKISHLYHVGSPYMQIQVMGQTHITLRVWTNDSKLETEKQIWSPLGRWLGSATGDTALHGPSMGASCWVFSTMWRGKAEGRFSHIILKSPKLGVSNLLGPKNLQHQTHHWIFLLSPILCQIAKKTNINHLKLCYLFVEIGETPKLLVMWLRFTPSATAAAIFKAHIPVYLDTEWIVGSDFQTRLWQSSHAYNLHHPNHANHTYISVHQQIVLPRTWTSSLSLK